MSRAPAAALVLGSVLIAALVLHFGGDAVIRSLFAIGWRGFAAIVLVHLGLIAAMGIAWWVLVPGELYQVFQTTMRSRFPRSAVVVGTITNDWQPGYLPTAASYGKGIYQESIAVVAPGTLESLIEVVAKELGAL